MDNSYDLNHAMAYYALSMQNEWLKKERIMEQKLRELIKEAMIEKKETGKTNRYQTYKNILETAQKLAKASLVEVTDSAIYDAAKKEIKQLMDLQAFCNPGTERYKDITECIEIAQSILPKMATPEEILSFLQSKNLEKNMGVCMKAVKAKFGDALDGKVASMVVKQYIA